MADPNIKIEFDGHIYVVHERVYVTILEALKPYVGSRVSLSESIPKITVRTADRDTTVTTDRGMVTVNLEYTAEPDVNPTVPQTDDEPTKPVGTENQ
jgi:hypothetical protein